MLSNWRNSPKINNVNNAIKPTFRENFKEFCKNTTFHGLKFVGDGKISWFERIFFGISFISVVCISGTFIYNVYEQWSSTPVIVSISSTPTFINQIPFPAVTICNMNQASAKIVQNITKNTPEHDMLELLCNENNVDPNTISNLTNWELFRNFIIKSAQPCKSMLVNCRFGQTSSRCSNIFQTVLTDEGLCCTFNTVHSSFMYSQINQLNISTSNDNNNTVPIDWNPEKGYPDILPKKFYPRIGAVRGLNEGLFLILDAQINDYYCSSTNGAGFKIAIHNPIETPNFKQVGLIIPVGVQSRIRITPESYDASTNIKSLPIRERQCVFQSENFLKSFKKYSQHNCEMEMYSKGLINQCNCVPYYLTGIQPNIRVCGINDNKCVQSFPTTIDKSKIISKDCQRNCYQSCYHLSYSTSTFSSEINGSGIYDIKEKLIQNMKNEYYINNTVVLQLFYQYNAFRANHKNEFIGTTEFLSNTGGLMGLFLGFSFISIVEIFYYASFRPCCAQHRYNNAMKKLEINDKTKIQKAHQDNRWESINFKKDNVKEDILKNSYNIQYYN